MRLLDVRLGQRGAGGVVATAGELDAALARVTANPAELAIIQVKIPERDLPVQVQRLITPGA